MFDSVIDNPYSDESEYVGTSPDSRFSNRIDGRNMFYNSKNDESTNVIDHICPKLDCQSMINHYENCPLCKSYIKNSIEKRYLITIVILIVIIIILSLKKRF